jgi:site-specific DNA recombinase
MPNLDGYIRVSRKLGRQGPGYISPDVQREAIERWAEYKGVQVAAWHVDEDESGGTQDRPALLAAVERSVSGETGGIVSWKIDRFSRYTEGGLRDLSRLEDAGARLVFVTEDIDTSGPMGKFVYTVMLAMGEYFLSSIKAGWVTTKTRAVARGVKIGPTPYGYERTKSAPLSPHPEQAGVVSKAYALAAESGLHAASDYLNANAPERVWALHRVRRFLANRTYLGETRYRELVKRDAHEPLVDRATWEAAQPTPATARKPSADYPLSGLAECGTCGAGMVGHRGGRNLRSYACSDKACTGRATTVADALESHVTEALLDALAGDEGFEVGTTDTGELAHAGVSLQDAERELADFATDTTARQLLGEERYHAALAERVATVGEAQASYRALAEDSLTKRHDVPTRDAWDEQTPAEMAESLRAAFATVVVQKGRGAIADRVRLVPHDAARVAAA